MGPRNNRDNSDKEDGADVMADVGAIILFLSVNIQVLLEEGLEKLNLYLNFMDCPSASILNIVI